MLYLPTWWKSNPPENPSHLAANERYLPKSLLDTFREGVADVSDTCTGRAPHQELELKQEQELPSDAARPAQAFRERKNSPDNGGVTSLVRTYRAIPGIDPTERHGGVLAGLASRYGAEAVAHVPPEPHSGCTENVGLSCLSPNAASAPVSPVDQAGGNPSGPAQSRQHPGS